MHGTVLEVFITGVTATRGVFLFGLSSFPFLIVAGLKTRITTWRTVRGRVMGAGVARGADLGDEKIPHSVKYEADAGSGAC